MIGGDGDVGSNDHVGIYSNWKFQNGVTLNTSLLNTMFKNQYTIKYYRKL
jgi:hypothetical protein